MMTRQKEQQKTNEEGYDLREAEPFLGRIKVKAVEQDPQKWLKKKYGLAEDSPFMLASGYTDEQTGEFHSEIKDQKVPLQMGEIIEMDPECFGRPFQKKFGSKHKYPIIGDIVLFVPMQTYKLDPKGEYHIIGDEDIVGIIRKKGKA